MGNPHSKTNSHSFEHFQNVDHGNGDGFKFGDKTQSFICNCTRFSDSLHSFDQVLDVRHEDQGWCCRLLNLVFKNKFRVLSKTQAPEFQTDKYLSYFALRICQGSTQWICNAMQINTNKANRAQHLFPNLTRCWPLARRSQLLALWNIQGDTPNKVGWSFERCTVCNLGSVISQNCQMTPVRSWRYPYKPQLYCGTPSKWQIFLCI